MRFLVYVWYLVLGISLFAPGTPSPSKIEYPNSPVLDEISEANDFYVSVINATTTASGELKYDFQGGQATSRIPGSLDIIWSIQAGTSASLKFNYQRSDSIRWKKLDFSFNRPITALFRQGRVDAKRQGISRIEFRQNGEPLEYYDEQGQPIGLALSQFPEIRQHLRIRELSSLLFGIPFAGFGQSPVASPNGFTVRRVTIPQGPPHGPIKLGLQPQSQIVFVNDGKDQSWIKPSDSAQLVVLSLVYDRFARSLDASLGPVRFNIADGHLASGRTSLNLAADGILSFEQLRFWSNNAEGINCFKATVGSFAGQLRPNSAVEIADGPDGPSLVELAAAEPANLDGLTVQGADDRSTMSVTTARLPVSGAQGQLSFGSGNKLRVRFQSAPPLAVSLQQTSWFSNQPPRVAGSIPGFSADVIDGRFLLNDRSTINLSAGQITSSGLSLSFPSTHPATGTLTQASFAIKEGTTFALGTDRLLLKIASGSVKASDVAGLTFSTNQVGPVGNLHFQNAKIAGGSLRLGNHGAVALESGNVDIDIRRDATITGKWAGNLVTSTGKLTIDGVNTYNIRRATLDIQSQNLSEAGVTGPFKSVSFAIGKSQLKFSNNFTASTADTGTMVEGNDPAAPVTIEADGEITGRIHVVAALVDGSIVPNPGSRVGLLPSSQFDAVFEKKSHHPVTGKLKISLRCGNGDIKLNKTTNVPISGGEIKAADLSYKEPDSLTGKLNKLDLETGPVTTVVPNALRVSSEAPGAIRGGDAVGSGSGFNLGGGCITFALTQQVKAGEVKLGKNSVANVTGGTMITTQRILCPGGQPDSTTIALDVDISSGKLQLNNETTLNINKSSHLKASALTVSEQNGVTGSIPQADLVLGESMLSIPRGFKMIVGPQSHVTVTAPAQHLEIDESGTAIYGTMVFDGPMKKFFNADPTSFQLRDGKMHFVLTQQPSGRIEGHEMSLTGAKMDIVITDPAMVLPVDFDLTNGEFVKDPGQEATLTADAVAAASSFSIDKETNCEGDRDDGMFFPIKYSVRARERAVILSGKIVLKGDQYELPGSNRTIGITLSVAAGQGEHEHERCNGEEGFGEMAPNQEAFTIWLKVCRFHLYLAPHDYTNATANLSVSFTGSNMSMTMSGLSLNDGLATDHSGCWPVGGLFEAVASIVIQRFKLPGLTFSIQHDFNPPPPSQ